MSTPTLAGILDVLDLAQNEAEKSQLPGMYNGPANAYYTALVAAELERRYGDYWAGNILGLTTGTSLWCHGQDYGVEGLSLPATSQDLNAQWSLLNSIVGQSIGSDPNVLTWDHVVDRVRMAINKDMIGQKGYLIWDWPNKWLGGPKEWPDYSKWNKYDRDLWFSGEPFPTPEPRERQNFPRNTEEHDPVKIIRLALPLIAEGARKLFHDALDALGLRARMDPLAVDLDGDGVETTSVSGGVFFDHADDGFAELSAWVAPDDGLLVMDRNADGIINDGSELFGDQTILKNGSKAENGFEALADLDSNKDGKIDSADAAFSQLRVWQDEDGDGYSLPDELHTLEEVGIRSINLDSTITNTTDENGNTENRAGSFEKTDGTTGKIAEYGFQREPMYTIPEEWLDVPDDIASLPNLQGYGNVYGLHQAMVRDTSGELRALVEQFSGASDEDSRSVLLNQILYKWISVAGTTGEIIFLSNFAPNKLAVLQSFFGESFLFRQGIPSIEPTSFNGSLESLLYVYEDAVRKGGTSGAGGIIMPLPSISYEAATWLSESYRTVFEMMYAGLMAQTHLKELYDKISYTWDDEKQVIKTNMSDVITDIQATLANNQEQGRVLLGEFARTLRGFGAQNIVDYLSFRETFVQMDPSLGWVMDTGGLTIFDHVGQGLFPLSDHMNGTDNSDAVLGSLTEGDGIINGLNGDDVIYGTDRDEVLYNETGDALLVAGGGNDTIWAGEGNDILDGGTGNDILYGEAGNDTYIFRRGSGQDTIIDVDATEGNSDTVWLGGNLTTDDVVLRRVGNNLVLKIKDSTDTLTVRDFFAHDVTLNKIERIVFMDGTTWGDSDILQKTFLATEADDTLYGGTTNDTINGLGGNDSIYGRGGDDTLHGDDTCLLAGPPVLFDRSSVRSRSVYLKTGFCACA